MSVHIPLSRGGKKHAVLFCVKSNRDVVVREVRWTIGRREKEKEKPTWSYGLGKSDDDDEVVEEEEEEESE
tara:strand:- start:67 stop:279 length:213 start_codon:yes stop_codon:yes gene_type:complete